MSQASDTGGILPVEECASEFELRGWLERGELVSLYERAAGFVHVGDEDFGISMVEALAAGTPVVALARGGAKDIVRDGVDGILVAEPTVGAVRAAVRAVASTTWSPPDLATHAREFSRERFVERFRDYLANATR